MPRRARPAVHAAPSHANGRGSHWRMTRRLSGSRAHSSTTKRDECGATGIAARPLLEISASRRRVRSTARGLTFAKLVCPGMTPAEWHDGASTSDGSPAGNWCLRRVRLTSDTRRIAVLQSTDAKRPTRDIDARDLSKSTAMLPSIQLIGMHAMQ